MCCYYFLVFVSRHLLSVPPWLFISDVFACWDLFCSAQTADGHRWGISTGLLQLLPFFSCSWWSLPEAPTEMLGHDRIDTFLSVTEVLRKWPFLSKPAHGKSPETHHLATEITKSSLGKYGRRWCLIYLSSAVCSINAQYDSHLPVHH